MVGLLDVHRAVKQVSYNGEMVDVYGISARGIAVLLQRFPGLLQMIAGEPLSRSDVAAMAPDAIAAVIAAACGYPGDPKAEKEAADMPIESQLDFLEAMQEVTFPRGFGPFVERLRSLSGAVVSASSSPTSRGDGQAGRRPASRSPKPERPSGPPATPPSGT
jgi:hypothetical protein